MERMWDAIKRSLQDGAAIAFDKAEGLTQVGRARLDIAAAKTRLSRLPADLGAAAFKRIEAGQSANIGDDNEIQDLCDRIREAAAALDASEEEFEQVRRELQANEADADGDPPSGV